jgi:excisionase family DNA binding protein
MRMLSIEDGQVILEALEAVTRAISVLANSKAEPVEDEVLSTRQAAELLGVSPSTMRAILISGKIPYKDLSGGGSKGLPRILKSDILAYMRLRD